MLILVTVTVNVAMNGGLFSQSQIAKTKTDKETDRERLTDLVLGAYDEVTGLVNFETLESSLPQEWSIESNEVTTAKGNDFYISLNGKILDEAPSQEGEKKSAEDLKRGDNVTIRLKDPINNTIVQLNNTYPEWIIVGDKCLALLDGDDEFINSSYIQCTTGRFDRQPSEIYLYFNIGTIALGTTITESGWYFYDGTTISRVTAFPSYTGIIPEDESDDVAISVTNFECLDQVFDFYVQ